MSGVLAERFDDSASCLHPGHMQLTQVNIIALAWLLFKFHAYTNWYFQLSSENHSYFWGKPTAFGCWNILYCNVLSLLICNSNLTEKKKKISKLEYLL